MLSQADKEHHKEWWNMNSFAIIIDSYGIQEFKLKSLLNSHQKMSPTGAIIYIVYIIDNKMNESEKITIFVL